MAHKLLITGGAGFVGSNLALMFKDSHPEWEITALDNLKRRGSELAVPRFKAAGINFIHGDVRIMDDLLEIGKIDTIIDCSAEPSVLAGTSGSPAYCIQTNLVGTINCLELARQRSARIVFLSTSRVYPIEPLNSAALTETETRFELSDNQKVPGLSSYGVSEQFPLAGPRSIYGASKLASELFLEEYIDSYKLQGFTNRCGVLTGPWQMGKTDQGVIVLWVAKHIYNQTLSYIGYGGTGKQVRDILHVRDLFDLVNHQLQNFEKFNGTTYNVGGGREVSVSLQELTELCQRFTGQKIKIASVKENRPNDLPIYLTDARAIQKKASWAPKIKKEQIIEEIARWISDNKESLRPILA